MAFAGRASVQSGTTFNVGDGITRPYDNTMYPNPALETGVDYYVFVRLFSSIDVSMECV